MSINASTQGEYGIMPGIGRISSNSVGDCRHTTGIDHFFQPAGSQKKIPGYVRFAAFVGDDGRIVWLFTRTDGPEARKREWDAGALTEKTQTDFPAEVVAEMRRLSETLHERDPGSWFFHALGAVSIEKTALERERHDLARVVATLAGQLSDPVTPRTMYVSAAEAGEAKGHERPSTPEERETYRAAWTARLADARTKLASFDETKTERLELLKRLYDVLDDWSRRAVRPRDNPQALYEAAIAA